MHRKIIPVQTVLLVLFSLSLITGCSRNFNSIPVTGAFPDATPANIRSDFEALGFSFAESAEYEDYTLTSAVSPDGMASLQIVGGENETQAVRVLIYLSVEATSEYANQQYLYFDQLFTSVFGDTWPAAEEWLITATTSISERNNTSLMGGASVTTPRPTDAGELPVSLYVRMDKDGKGFIMGLVVGDWLDDIGYNPAKNVWEP
jgi:hypothetical protein